MSILKLAFELFILYLLYKLVFDFIIPVARTTSQVKKQFRHMNEKMQEQKNQHQNMQDNGRQQNTTQAKKPVGGDDYIEFEEVK